MSNTNQYGLIILGNSGVGKSFLANIITGYDVFLHQFQATSVTHNTTSVDITLGSHTFTIFDIPGLIEAQQERIDLNKQEIDKAFIQRPNSIILFVFGQVNGRLRAQDIVAFNAINAAYPFKQGSLLLVVNGVPKNRPSDYAEETLADLQKLLKNVNVNNNNLCFTDLINVNDANAKQILKSQLVPVSLLSYVCLNNFAFNLNYLFSNFRL